MTARLQAGNGRKRETVADDTAPGGNTGARKGVLCGWDENCPSPGESARVPRLRLPLSRLGASGGRAGTMALALLVLSSAYLPERGSLWPIGHDISTASVRPSVPYMV